MQSALITLGKEIAILMNGSIAPYQQQIRPSSHLWMNNNSFFWSCCSVIINYIV